MWLYTLPSATDSPIAINAWAWSPTATYLPIASAPDEKHPTDSAPKDTSPTLIAPAAHKCGGSFPNDPPHGFNIQDLLIFDLDGYQILIL